MAKKSVIAGSCLSDSLPSGLPSPLRCFAKSLISKGHDERSKIWYFPSRRSNAGLVPSSTSTMSCVIVGSSSAPLVYATRLPSVLSSRL